MVNFVIHGEFCGNCLDVFVLHDRGIDSWIPQRGPRWPTTIHHNMIETKIMYLLYLYICMWLFSIITHTLIGCSWLPSPDMLSTFTYKCVSHAGVHYTRPNMEVQSQSFQVRADVGNPMAPLYPLLQGAWVLKGDLIRREIFLFSSFQSRCICVQRALFCFAAVRWQLVVDASCGWCCRWPTLC